ncbi:MAG: SCP2 sterol-binding domain-containing protein [Candidatus Helarchaeota archaeon]
MDVFGVSKYARLGSFDFVGLALYHMFNSNMEVSQKFRDRVKKTKEKIVLDLDMYPIMINLTEVPIEITRYFTEEPTIIVKMPTQDLLHIVEGKSSMIRSFLTGKMKLKRGITKLMKVYNLFSKVL